MSTLLVPRSDVGEFRKRFKWLALFASLAFLVLAGRMFQLQVVDESQYAAVAHENIIRRVTLPTTRGVIRDANGRVLASSRPSYDGRLEASTLPLTSRMTPRVVGSTTRRMMFSCATAAYCAESSTCS